MPASLLAGRTALVTGASRGIGAAVARSLGAHGAAVAVNYHRSAEAAAGVVAAIESSGGRAVAVPGDACDAAQVARMVAATREALGEPDILVCNVMAGTERLGAKAAAGGGSFIDSGERLEDVKGAVTAQLDTVLACCHAVVPGMRRLGGGSIVLIGASATHNSHALLPEIVVAKSAQDAVARCLARELAPDNIRVNTVAPGFVPTDANAGPRQAAIIDQVAAHTPLRDPVLAEDVADAVTLLVSPLALKATGLFLPLDGGQTTL